MPPKITSVKWQLKGWLPEGLDFDNPTGTISGTPTEIGTFTVPIFVKTNYGEAMEDVKIIVEPPAKDVYAVGAKAETWSENAAPDADGFRLLNMPKAYRLADHYDGFGALTAESGYWCCGPCRPARLSDYPGNMSYFFYPSDSSTPKTNYLYRSTKPVCFADEFFSMGVPNPPQVDIVKYADKVIFMDYNYKYQTSGDNGGSSTTRQGTGLLVWNSNKCEYYAMDCNAKEVNTAWHTGQGTHTDTQVVAMPIPVPKEHYRQYVSPANGVGALGDSCYLYYTSSANLLFLGDDKKVRGDDLTSPSDFTVKKIFTRTTFFQGHEIITLSENGYLNNNPELFTHGTIKDAWYGDYVQTTANQIYKIKSITFSAAANGWVYTWEQIGEIDNIKKFWALNNQIFILKNDGRLYHKGAAITGLFNEAHDTFTHVFPNITFQDFTFGSNTLTVLKE